jgi:hypothetical protein
MLQPFQIAFLVFAGIIPIYLHSFWRLYGIIKTEKPDWVKRRGSPSFLYDNLLRVIDPGVYTTVLRIAFSSRVNKLQSRTAIRHAMVIRVLLPVSFVLFTSSFIAALASAY